MSSPNIIGDDASAAERREHVRVGVRQILTYNYYDESGQKLGVGVGTTVNVSEEGMLLTTDKFLIPGMQMLVEIVSHLFVFMATARIVHVTEIGDTLYQVGLQYLDVIQGDWSVLDMNH
jgi:hypothetical protein